MLAALVAARTGGGCNNRLAGGQGVTGTCTVTWKRSPALPGSSPPASALSATNPSASATPLRDRRLGVRRGRRRLHQRRLHRVQQHPRPPRGSAARAAPACPPRPPACAACGSPAFLLAIRLRVAVRLPPAAHQPFHLRRGGAAGHRQQPRFGVRRGDPGQGRGLSNRRSCRTPSPPRCGSARRARPLCAAARERHRGRGRCASLSHCAQDWKPSQPHWRLNSCRWPQQLVGGGVDARRQLGDLVPEPVQVGRLGTLGCLGRVGGVRGLLTLPAGSSVVAGRVSVLVSVFHDGYHTPGLRAPRDGPWRGRMPIWGFSGRLLLDDGQGARYARSETESGRVGGGAELDCSECVNP